MMNKIVSVTCLLLFGCVMEVNAISYNLSFDDPTREFGSYYADITSHTRAAGATWSKHLQSNVILDVRVGFSDISTATGRSLSSVAKGSVNGVRVFEQGAGHEVRTGLDNNPGQADIEIIIGKNYLENELWFDPFIASFSNNTLVGNNKTDAYSVFLHEFGHAFAFSGWKNPFTGAIASDEAGQFQSTFDALVMSEAGNLFFIGENAQQVYGDKVPLTSGNFAHVGNDPENGRPGADLVPGDLMNGVAFQRGHRYQISALDLAILEDVGIPTVVPIPAAVWLFFSGFLSLLGFSRVTNKTG
jgi:hypothetical protein